MTHAVKWWLLVAFVLFLAACQNNSTKNEAEVAPSAPTKKMPPAKEKKPKGGKTMPTTPRPKDGKAKKPEPPATPKGKAQPKTEEKSAPKKEKPSPLQPEKSSPRVTPPKKDARDGRHSPRPPHGLPVEPPKTADR